MAHHASCIISSQEIAFYYYITLYGETELQEASKKHDCGQIDDHIRERTKLMLIYNIEKRERDKRKSERSPDELDTIDGIRGGIASTVALQLLNKGEG